MACSACWWLYLIRTANGHLYCGVTTDVTRRFHEHSNSVRLGAKSLRGKGPLRLVYTYKAGDKSLAMQLEYRLKKWPKSKKEALVRGDFIIEDIVDSKYKRKLIMKKDH